MGVALISPIFPDDPVTFVVEAGTAEATLGVHPFPYASGPITYTVTDTTGEGWFKLAGIPLAAGQVVGESELGALTFTAPATGSVYDYLRFMISTDDSGVRQTTHYDIVVIVKPAENATYVGTPDSDVLDGGAGNDRIDGRGGADVMIGGAGNDTIVVDNTGDRVVETTGIDTVLASIGFSLANGTLVSGAVENLTLAGGNLYGIGNALSNIITGGGGNNVLDGGQGNDSLFGGAGFDRLVGGMGNDTLSGGAGIDWLCGGSGKDVFVFDTAPNTANRDLITDFSHADDTFQLDHAVFTRLGSLAGAHGLSPAFFHTGPTSADANDYIVYNRATGVLAYDVNGSDRGGVSLLAVLANRPVLAANDFVVI